MDINTGKSKTVTYFRAAHFGKGDKENEVDYAYGQYQDNWQRQATGTWRIVHWNLVYMVSAFSHELAAKKKVLAQYLPRVPKLKTCLFWCASFKKSICIYSQDIQA